jgi:cyclic pyranopterin phosphate synthase
MSKKKFTHVSSTGLPQMVNVADKKVTVRTARAKAVVDAGEEIIGLIQNDEIVTKKARCFKQRSSLA